MNWHHYVVLTLLVGVLAILVTLVPHRRPLLRGTSSEEYALAIKTSGHHCGTVTMVEHQAEHERERWLHVICDDTRSYDFAWVASEAGYWVRPRR